MNEIKHPQPLKFEDLTPGMWVYDAPYEEIVRIKEIESNEWIFLECIKSMIYLIHFSRRKILSNYYSKYRR